MVSLGPGPSCLWLVPSSCSCCCHSCSCPVLAPALVLSLATVLLLLLSTHLCTVPPHRRNSSVTSNREITTALVSAHSGGSTTSDAVAVVAAIDPRRSTKRASNAEAVYQGHINALRFVRVLDTFSQTSIAAKSICMTTVSLYAQENPYRVTV